MTLSPHARIALIFSLLATLLSTGCNSLLGIEDSKLRTADPSSTKDAGSDAEGVECGQSGCDAAIEEGGVSTPGTEDASIAPDGGMPACEESGLRCEGRAQTERSACQTGAWAPATSCALGELCDLNSAACLPTIAGCSGRLPGYVSCIGRNRTTCGGDLVTSETQTCSTVEHCAEATGMSCLPCVQGEYRCEGDNLEVCLPDQSGFLLSATCKAGQCKASLGTCSDKTCTANQYSCQGNVLRRCNAQGSAFSEETPCLEGICDAKNGQCDACAANQRFCSSGTTRSVCSADGQKLTSAECATESAATPRCSGDGLCVGCVADETMCDGNTNLRTCSKTGTWGGPAACNNQTCVGKACKGVCSPGQARCTDKVLELCQPSGEWGGAQTCSALCQEDTESSARCVACEANQYKCVGDELQACNSAQSDFAKVNTCAAGLCDAVNRRCKDQVCNPKEVSCQGNVLSTCNADGTAYTSQVSCGSGICDAKGNGGAGQCDTCTPAAVLGCENGSSQKVCSADGQSPSARVCPASAPYCVRSGSCVACLLNDTMCVDGSRQRTCLGNDVWGQDSLCVDQTCVGKACAGTCAPGQSQCSGTTGLQTCQANGFFGGTQTCSKLCKQDGKTARCVACAVNEYTCNVNTLQVCDANQAGFRTVSVCESGLCDAANGRCKDKVCNANQVTCDGNVLAKCNADGSAYANRLDCGSNKCDAAGNSGNGQCDLCVANNLLGCFDADERSVCSADGQSLTRQACPGPTPVCIGAGSCVACTPNVDDCLNTDVLSDCDAAGTLKSVSCAASNKTCSNDQCTGSCAAGKHRCNAGNSELCDGTGTWQNSQACTAPALICNTSTGLCQSNPPFSAGKGSTTGGMILPGGDTDLLATPIVVTDNVDLRQLGIHTSGASTGGTVRLTLYDDIVDPDGKHRPGKIITYTNAFNLATNSNNLHAPVNNGVRLTAGTLYWAAVKLTVSGNTVEFYYFDSTLTVGSWTAGFITAAEAWGSGFPPATFPIANQFTRNDRYEIGVFLQVQRY